MAHSREIQHPSFAVGLVPIMFGGFCTGLNAITTQSLRRKLATLDQFPEVAGLEVVLGKITDWIVSSGTFYLIAAGFVDYRAATYIAALFLLFLGAAHLIGRLKNI